MPEVFSSRGYVTGAFSGNATWVTPEYLGKGFLRFKVYSLENHFRRTSYGRILSRMLDLVGVHRAGRGRKAQDVNRDFLRFLDGRTADRPFFAYLCYMDVNQAFHHRRMNRPKWSHRPPNSEVFEAYKHGLRTLDEEIGTLLATLDTMNLRERTIIVVTSDHGESFGAEVAPDHDPVGHGTSLFGEQTRVPLLVVTPRDDNGPSTVAQTVSLQAVPRLLAKELDWEDDTFADPLIPRTPGVALASLHYAAESASSCVGSLALH